MILTTESDMRRCGLCRLPLSECDCEDDDETEDGEESD